MARKDSDHQKQSMSLLFRGKAIFKPLNTGRIDEHVACVREWVANIFFYTKNGVTIMIDAGYNYERLQEKMKWLDIDPSSIRHILITHQDTDHVGALETDSEQLFRDATVYIGEIENRYLTGETRRKVIHGLYRLPMVRSNNKKVLLKDGEILSIDGIKIECILVPGHTWGHMVYLVDDEYLFTGDTIWFGADGGYSFIATLAEDNRLAVRSLEKLEKNLRARNKKLKIITGHTGWTDDMDFAFLHRTELCKPFVKKYADPTAPYDGYEEDDDIEEQARNVRLEKVCTEIKPDYKNWMPDGMVRGTMAGAAVCAGLSAAIYGSGFIKNETVRNVLSGSLLFAGAAAGGASLWMKKMHDSQQAPSVRAIPKRKG
ncbi:MAG: MBL fold metallo-hydrolase [Lachnospiraceae bacterium]|nr:MBL fold metallo-hydrolase [Lachnospiraceae bacterium]